jgi:two-component system, cell cycle response regulator DivK
MGIFVRPAHQSFLRDGDVSLILLIEDNPLDADMLSRRLSRKGYEVVAAPDGETGIAVANQRSPALIIMDMGLPGIDGWEATRRLKASPATAGIPVVALTAHAMAEDKNRGLAAGCDWYETKPLEFEKLVFAIQTLIRNGGTV